MSLKIQKRNSSSQYILRFFKKNWDWLVVLTITLATYLYSLPSAYTWKNYGFLGGDFLSAIVKNGVPHPTGYALFLLLAKLYLKLVFFIEPALAMNFFSAIWGTLTVLITFLIIKKLTKNKPASIFGALILAFNQIFWAQSIVIEATTLYLFLLSLATYFVVFQNRLPFIKKQMPGYFLALILGLSISVYPTAVLSIPAILLLYWSKKINIDFTSWNWTNKSFSAGVNERLRWPDEHRGGSLERMNPDEELGPISECAFYRAYAGSATIFKNILAFVLGLSPYLYIYFLAKSDSFYNWGNPSNLSRFFEYITAQHYARYFYLSTDLVQHFFEIASIFPQTLTWIGVWLALFGLLVIYLRKKTLFWTSLIWFVLNLSFVFVFHFDNAVIFHLPNFLFISIWIGFGAVGLIDIFRALLGSIPQSIASLLVFKSEKYALSFQQVLLITFWIILFLLPLQIFRISLKKTALHDDKTSRIYFDQVIESINQTAVHEIKVIVPDSDEITFALRYYLEILSLDRVDIILLLDDGIYDSDLKLSQFKKRFPEFVYPQHPTGVNIQSNSEGLAKFILANLDRFDFYHADLKPFDSSGMSASIYLEMDLALIRVGPIYKIGIEKAPGG